MTDIPDPSRHPYMVEAMEHLLNQPTTALPCDPHPIVNGLHLRRALGRQDWDVPQIFGCCGWSIATHDQARHILVTADHVSDTVNWIHASIAHHDHIPTHDDLTLLHRAAFGEKWAYQIFAPPTAHINIHPRALHLWGRVDGQAALPDFGQRGTI